MSERNLSRSNAVRLSIFDPYFIEERSILKGVLECTPHFKGVVLDIGCGTQNYIGLLKPKTSRYIGFDLDLEVLKKSSEINIGGNFNSLPFKNGSIDTIFSTQVINGKPCHWRIIHQ